MKVRVIKAFVDRQSKKVRKVGDVFDCTSERLGEIKKAGSFVEPVPSKEPKETE